MSDVVVVVEVVVVDCLREGRAQRRFAFFQIWFFENWGKGLEGGGVSCCCCWWWWWWFFFSFIFLLEEFNYLIVVVVVVVILLLVNINVNDFIVVCLFGKVLVAIFVVVVIL